MYQQKNKLKDLIYIQENKPCNEQTVNGLFRSIVEPILEQNLEGIVLCRMEEKSKETFRGILKRLEYSNSKVYDFSDKPISENFEYVLKENIWGKTEFVYVLAPRFGAVLIFDYEENEMNGFAQIYLLHNSKNLSDAFEVINANSKIDLIEYQKETRLILQNGFEQNKLTVQSALDNVAKKRQTYTYVTWILVVIATLITLFFKK